MMGESFEGPYLPALGLIVQLYCGVREIAASHKLSSARRQSEQDFLKGHAFFSD